MEGEGAQSAHSLLSNPFAPSQRGPGHHATHLLAQHRLQGSGHTQTAIHAAGPSVQCGGQGGKAVGGVGHTSGRMLASGGEGHRTTTMRAGCSARDWECYTPTHQSPLRRCSLQKTAFM